MATELRSAKPLLVFSYTVQGVGLQAILGIATAFAQPERQAV
jgi:hypothetical protein